jgi:hypothetical protein
MSQGDGKKEGVKAGEGDKTKDKRQKTKERKFKVQSSRFKVQGSKFKVKRLRSLGGAAHCRCLKYVDQKNG